MTLKMQAFVNIVEKAENVGNQHFFLSFFPSYQRQCHPSDIVSKIDLLTHYPTMQHFDALKIYSCRTHFEKRRNCL